MSSYRLVDLGHIRPVLEQVLRVALREGHGGHLLNIGTGGEGLVRTGDDDAANLTILVKLSAGIDDLIEQGVAECIQELGSVQGDDTDVVLDLGQDVLVRSGTVIALLQLDRARSGASKKSSAMHLENLFSELGCSAQLMLQTSVLFLR